MNCVYQKSRRWSLLLSAVAVLTIHSARTDRAAHAQSAMAVGTCRDGSCRGAPYQYPAAPPFQGDVGRPAAEFPRLPLDSVVRIRHRQSEGGGREIVSWGTGTVIRDCGQTLIVTCAHLFRGSLGSVDVL